MFSVIIPLFNKELFIEKAVKSVITQTFAEFELIIINDGSTDNSLHKIQKFIDSRIIIVDQENSGVSTARNNGVKLAKYEYIAFLDADDWWDPNYLMEMKHLIEEFPEAGIYGSNYYIVKNEINKIANIGVESDFTKGLIEYCRVYSKTLCMPIWTGAAVLKKSVFESEGGFTPYLKLGEDFDLWIRIALKYPVAFLNKPLSYYNQDVEMADRGVSRKLYEKEAYFSFQLSYLNEAEKANPDLKKLLDSLKAISLEHFYIHKRYLNEVKEIIKQIDFNTIPPKVKLTYTLPFPVAKIRYQFYQLASKIKSTIKRHIA